MGGSSIYWIDDVRYEHSSRFGHIKQGPSNRPLWLLSEHNAILFI